MRPSSSRIAIAGRMAAAKIAVGSTLYARPMASRVRLASATTSRRDSGSTLASGMGIGEGHERARLVPDRVPDHLGPARARTVAAGA